MSKSPITTHILDLGSGKPAAGVRIVLEQQQGDSWVTLASAETDADGDQRRVEIGHLFQPFHRMAQRESEPLLLRELITVSPAVESRRRNRRLVIATPRRLRR